MCICFKVIILCFLRNSKTPQTLEVKISMLHFSTRRHDSLPHGGDYTASFSLHFYPLEETVHAGGHSTHLFLDPNDVKGFPLKFQLAHIIPATNNMVKK